MIKTILVPLDGSPVAEQGLVAACRIARETGAALLLVRSVVYFAVEEATREEERRDVREAREYLDTVQRDLERQGFAVTAEVLPVEPVRAILFAAEAHAVDLISICTHGRSGFEHALLGSVAEAVLQRSVAPILLTRADGHAAPPTAAPYGRILVPLDGTAFAETALSYLRDQGIGRAASLLLLRVVPPESEPSTYTSLPSIYGVPEAFELVGRQAQAHQLEGEAYLRALGTARLADGTWHPRVVIGEAGEAILAVAGRERAELIALATHGRHGWDRLLHGSVTRHLLHRSTTPMLILRGAGAEPGADGAPASVVHAAPAAMGAGRHRLSASDHRHPGHARRTLAHGGCGRLAEASSHRRRVRAGTPTPSLVGSQRDRTPPLAAPVPWLARR